MATVAVPIQLHERNKLIDVLRGFALFGVLIANLEGFVTFALSEQNARQLITTPADKCTEIFLSLFIENKFITLFSLLFGYGFGVVIDRVADRGMRVNNFFIKRMFILLLIGLLHICFWWGEILSTYALCGMLLLCFRKVNARGLLIWGGMLLFIICPLIQGLKWFLLPDASAIMDYLLKKYLEAIYSGNIFKIAEHNYKIIHFIFIQRWSQYRDMAEILGKFLFGYYILRKNVLSGDNPSIGILKKTLYCMAPVAILYVGEKAIFYFYEIEINSMPLKLIVFIFDRAGILSMSLVYAVSIALLFYEGKMRLVFKALQPPGMMSLTNYLMHTFFMYYFIMVWGLG